MSKKKPGRDWSEWQKQLAGEERIANKWKAPNLENRIQDIDQDETTASMVLPRGFQRGHSDDRKMLKWILIFIGLMLARKVYFEISKSDKVRSSPTSYSRSR